MAPPPNQLNQNFNLNSAYQMRAQQQMSQLATPQFSRGQQGGSMGGHAHHYKRNRRF